MSNRFSRKIDELLRDTGATLIRKRKHKVWSLPNGKRFVQASTPSSQFAIRKEATKLQRTLDAKPKGTGQRRERPQRPGRPDVIQWDRPKFNNALAEQLERASLRQYAADLEYYVKELEGQASELIARCEAAETEIEHQAGLSWWQRLLNR